MDKFEINIDFLSSYKSKKELTEADFENSKILFSIFDKNGDHELSEKEISTVFKQVINSSETNTNDTRANNYAIFDTKEMLHFIESNKNQLGETFKNLGVSVSEVYNFINTLKDNYIKTDNSQNIEFDDTNENIIKKNYDSNGYIDKTRIYKNDYSKAYNLEETHNLKDISQMNDEEIKNELKMYGIDCSKINDLKRTLQEAREERAIHDIGSNDIDFHIGTYVQGRSLYCTILATLDRMSDNEIKEMVKEKIDRNGNKTYEVTFPQDYCTEGNSVEISETELKSGEISVDGRVLNDFPEGDADITLITMAFVKRFGTDITDNGDWIFKTKNKFNKPQNEEYKDNQYLEKINNNNVLLNQSVIAMLSEEEISRKGIKTTQLKDEDLSWITDSVERALFQTYNGVVETLSDGRKAAICNAGIMLSDGTKISAFHAMSIRAIDSNTNEFIISGSEFNNLSEVRVPLELLKYFETGSTSDIAGVKDTPEPID